VATGSVSAHQMWIEIDAMCVDLSDTVDAGLTEGHNFAGEGALGLFAELLLSQG